MIAPTKHAVAHFVAGDADAEFVDHSDGLVTDGEAGLDGIFAFENVEVGAADRGQGDTDDSFARPRLRDGNVLNTYLVWAAEDEGFHRLGFAEAMVELYFLRCNGHHRLLSIDLYLLYSAARNCVMTGVTGDCDVRHFVS